MVATSMPGCGNDTVTTPPDSTEDVVRNAMGRLPTPDTGLVGVLPIAPDGAYAFGFGLDNGTRLLVTELGDDYVSVDVVDESRERLWSEIRAPDSFTFVLPTGDSMVFSRQGDLDQVILVAAATSPESRFVLTEGTDGEMHFDEAASVLGTSLLDKRTVNRKAAESPRGPGNLIRCRGDKDDCHEIAVHAVEILDAACEFESLFSLRNVEQRVLESICIANDRMLDWAQHQSGSFSGLIAAVQEMLRAVCTAAHIIIDGANGISNPVSFLCLAVGHGGNLVEIFTGQPFDEWIADTICGVECGEGREYNAETHTCECIPPLVQDATGHCGCANGGTFNPDTRSCECAGGMVENPQTGRCECPLGMNWDSNLAECRCTEGDIVDPTADWDTPACLTCSQGAVRLCELRDIAVDIAAELDAISARIRECQATPGCDSGPLLNDQMEWLAQYVRIGSSIYGIYFAAALTAHCENMAEFDACMPVDGLPGMPNGGQRLPAADLQSRFRFSVGHELHR